MITAFGTFESCSKGISKRAKRLMWTFGQDKTQAKRQCVCGTVACLVTLFQKELVSELNDAINQDSISLASIVEAFGQSPALVPAQPEKYSRVEEGNRNCARKVLICYIFEYFEGLY